MARQEKFAEKENVPFPLLSDEKAAVAKKYGVYQKKKMYGKEFWGVQRTTFVVAPDGRIAKIWPKVKVDGHVDDVLTFVKSMGKE